MRHPVIRLHSHVRVSLISDCGWITLQYSKQESNGAEVYNSSVSEFVLTVLIHIYICIHTYVCVYIYVCTCKILKIHQMRHILLILFIFDISFVSKCGGPLYGGNGVGRPSEKSRFNS